jgi:hypothetical protein
LYSVTALVPINNRIKSNPPPDWKTYRRRWDLLHRWRVVLLTIAFGFLIVGFVSRVPLDKSEGPVKQKLSLTMREHRCVCQKTLSTKTLESTCT